MKAAKEIMQHNLAAVRNTSISGLVDKFLSAAAQVPEKHQRYFRWFGCGDAVNGKLQAAILGLSRIDRWFRQAWCPTQVNEWPLVRKYAYSSTLLRHTAPNVGDVPPPGGHSVLLPNQVMPGSYRCPGKCGLCRVCWLPWHRWISIVFPFHGSAILQAKLKKARKEHDF